MRAVVPGHVLPSLDPQQFIGKIEKKRSEAAVPQSPSSPSEDPSRDVKQPVKVTKAKEKTNINEYEDLMKGMNSKEAEAKQQSIMADFE